VVDIRPGRFNVTRRHADADPRARCPSESSLNDRASFGSPLPDTGGGLQTTHRFQARVDRSIDLLIEPVGHRRQAIEM